MQQLRGSVFSLALMSKGEKRTGVPLLPLMPRGEIFGMFYRHYRLVIDGKYSSKDGSKHAKDCREVIDDKIRVSIDEKQEQSKIKSN
jgi:hypothetical protein